MLFFFFCHHDFSCFLSSHRFALYRSNLDRIAYSLMVSKAHGLRPYVSLDAKWCSDWGRKVGRSKYGDFYC